MAGNAPLPPLNYAALADALLPMADDLVAQWLPGGVRRGHEYVCGSLAGGKGDSCSVNLVNGKWADFSSEERGNDLVSGGIQSDALFNTHRPIVPDCFTLVRCQH